MPCRGRLFSAREGQGTERERMQGTYNERSGLRNVDSPPYTGKMRLNVFQAAGSSLSTRHRAITRPGEDRDSPVTGPPPWHTARPSHSSTLGRGGMGVPCAVTAPTRPSLRGMNMKSVWLNGTWRYVGDALRRAADQLTCHVDGEEINRPGHAHVYLSLSPQHGGAGLLPCCC